MVAAIISVSSTCSSFPSSLVGTSSPFSSSSSHVILPCFPASHDRSRGRERFAYLQVRVSSSSAHDIEKEKSDSQKPATFLGDCDEVAQDPNSVRARFEKMIRDAQTTICSAIELVDGGGKFKEDVWSKPGGGGGISRVLQDGAVWEKAGVSVTVLYGVMPPEAYRAAKPTSGAETSDAKPGHVPFYAAGIGSVFLYFCMFTCLLRFLTTAISHYLLSFFEIYCDLLCNS